MPLPAYVASTMISGKVGMTRKTLVIIDSTSSAMPPRYAADTPISTDSTVAKQPGHQRDDQRLPGAVDQLGPDVLPERGRAEPVLRRTARSDGVERAARSGARTEREQLRDAPPARQKTTKMTSADHRLAAGSGPRASSPPPRRRVGGLAARRAVVVSTSSAVIAAHAFARARGSSQAIAKSQISSATSTATVNSMNSACISG